MFEKLIEVLLTKSNADCKEKSFNSLIANMTLVFSIAEIKQNEFYNHYAFALLQHTLNMLNEDRIKRPYDRLLTGLFLNKCIQWGFVNARLDATFEKLDDYCQPVLKHGQPSATDVFWTLAYGLSRLENNRVESLVTGLPGLCGKLEARLAEQRECLSKGTLLYLYRQFQRLKSVSGIENFSAGRFENFIEPGAPPEANAVDKSFETCVSYKDFLDYGFARLLETGNQYQPHVAFYSIIFE